MKKLFSLVAVCAALSIGGGAALAQFNPTPNTTPGYSGSKAANTAIANRSGPPTKWAYVGPTGGITSATSVTLKTAAGGVKKLHLSGARFYNSGAAGTELVINCGAAGTAIWRGWIGATSTLSIDPPFTLDCPTANTLMEVVTVSGTTIAIRVFAQGYTD